MDTPFVNGRNRADIFRAPKFQEALAALLDASSYAGYTDGDIWQFAINARELCRHGLTENDLRFLVKSKFVHHSHEITKPDGLHREFTAARAASSSERSCFVLTPLGIAAASMSLNGQLDDRSQGPESIRITKDADDDCEVLHPSWDAQHRVLTFGGSLIKRFWRRAGNQERVLAAFEEEGWPHRILDPLAPSPDAKRHLSDTIRWLNRGQENELLHFRGDGTGEGIIWDAVQ
jgi:hypothetical protein